MVNVNDVRRAHDLLDEIMNGRKLGRHDVDHLRSFLPERPKQKTLEEITTHVLDAWSCTSDNYWGGDGFDPDITIEDWLGELHAQLQGLKDAPATVPALPPGMRLADHKEYGRVITSPKPNRDGVYDLLVPRPKFETGADWEYAHKCELTFIDSEPANPAHPEFLETEADYENAPDGTIVAADKVSTAWIKTSEAWHSTDGDHSVECPNLSVGTRRVLRWGWQGE